MDFLTQLNEKLPIQEGVEGHRAILREVYRAGNISVKELARRTLLPVPLVARVVNFLIEKEILDRIPEGILYTEKGMQFIEKELGFYGFGIASCDQCDGKRMFISPRWIDMLEEIEDIFNNRPQVDTKLDQSLNDPETAVQRALYLYNNGSLEGKRVLFMGDDDFTSVAVAHLYLGVYPDEPQLIPSNITVVDIDTRILTQIQKVFKQKLLPLDTEIWDYRRSVPSRLCHQFDIVVLDPPYSLPGLILTLSRAISLLKTHSGTEIYLSYAHRSPSEWLKVQQKITEMGLAIQEIIPRFNMYEGCDILGNITQMVRLISTDFTKPIIAIDQNFDDAIYTGEINPKIRYYYCVSCRKLIELSSMGQIQTIEQLKSDGCPYCKSKGPFELDEKIEGN